MTRPSLRGLPYPTVARLAAETHAGAARHSQRDRIAALGIVFCAVCLFGFMWGALVTLRRIDRGIARIEASPVVVRLHAPGQPEQRAVLPPLGVPK